MLDSQVVRLRPDLPAAPSYTRGIRACGVEDLTAVATLYESVVRSGKSTPPPGLAGYFKRTFFDCPSADPEIPSLVYEDESGRIAGFIGSHVRRLHFDGRAIRLACAGQLIVDPRFRSKAVGAMLLRTSLRGPQDVTITDGANETVRGMWALCGGETAHLKTLTWTRILRPLRFGADYALGRLKSPLLASRLAPLWRPLDRGLGLAVRRLRPAAPATSAEPLTPRAMLEYLPRVTHSLRCHPDYDEAFLYWLFHEMKQVKSRGTLVRSLVRDSRGEVIGWHVYYLKDGLAQVMQLAAKRGAAADVLDDLLYRASENGAAAVRGRVEPHLLDLLPQRKCVFGWSGAALVHARTPELRGVLLSSQSWLERLDGESWMGHHTEAFT